MIFGGFSHGWDLAKKDISFFALRELYIAITMASTSIVLTYVTLALQQKQYPSS
jgi:hypothetical protein